jgi:hypothetical protein
MKLSRVERVAIEAILSKAVDGMEVVRMQFAAASVTERDYTGIGFYTTITVPASVPPMPDSKELHDALFAGAGGHVKSDPEGVVLFILWAHKGYLACLEGYTLGGSWPNEDDIEGVVPLTLCRDKPVQSSDSVAPGEIRENRRVRFSQYDLIPDCENRFAVWIMTTKGTELLVKALIALLVGVIVTLILLGLVSVFL